MGEVHHLGGEWERELRRGGGMYVGCDERVWWDL